MHLLMRDRLAGYSYYVDLLFAPIIFLNTVAVPGRCHVSDLPITSTQTKALGSRATYGNSERLATTSVENN